VINTTLQRHVSRATSSVMSQGGFTVESGRLMQQLLDLQGLCSSLDVRDDHLCEERGERFTQEALREAFLMPINSLWRAHARSWFCATKIDQSDVGLYNQTNQRQRHRKRLLLEQE
jgi:hypothetical protein